MIVRLKTVINLSSPRSLRKTYGKQRNQRPATGACRHGLANIPRIRGVWLRGGKVYAFVASSSLVFFLEPYYSNLSFAPPHFHDPHLRFRGWQVVASRGNLGPRALPLPHLRARPVPSRGSGSIARCPRANWTGFLAPITCRCRRSPTHAQG